jgi:diadenosine tetraphosphate (Ap4A) HIT family hydrolase
MQSRSNVSSDAGTIQANCSFCQRSRIAHYILKETPTFRIVADHAPLVPGHTLIVPINHYACYGDVPASLDEELLALKREVQTFLARYYASVVFWEHGIFHQTVFHAHLHCFPFGAETRYDPSQGLHEQVVHSQDDIRAWYQTRGQYFYLEDAHAPYLFAPNMDAYSLIIREVLVPGALAHGRQPGWRSPQQRQAEGAPLIEELKAKWQQFQQQEATHADQTNS